MAYNLYDTSRYAQRAEEAQGREESSRERMLNLLEEQRREQQNLYDVEQAEIAAAERDERLNTQDEALQGAQTGMAFGPWGALIGAGIGMGVGGHESAQESGGSFGDYANAFLNPVKHTKDLFGAIKGNPQQGQAVAGGLGSQIQGRMNRNDALQQSEARSMGASVEGGDPQNEFAVGTQDGKATGSLSHKPDWNRFGNEPTSNATATAAEDDEYLKYYGGVGV